MTITSQSGTKQPKLLDCLCDAIRTKHYSYKTGQTYIQWLKRFVLYHDKRHPTELVETEINEYLSYLALASLVSAFLSVTYLEISARIVKTISDTRKNSERII